MEVGESGSTSSHTSLKRGTTREDVVTSEEEQQLLKRKRIKKLLKRLLDQLKNLTKQFKKGQK